MATYSDLNLNFIMHPNTRDVVKRFDLDAVKHAVLNLIQTNYGEKKFKPNFGGNLRALLFEPTVAANKELLKRQWNEMINMYEPRVSIVDMEVTTENSEVYIVLTLALRDRQNVTFTLPISVDRIR